MTDRRSPFGGIVVSTLVVIGIAAVVVTAVLTVGRADVSPLAKAEPPPDTRSMLLEESDLRRLLGESGTMDVYADSTELYPGYTPATSPLECDAVISFNHAPLYVGVDWHSAESLTLSRAGADWPYAAQSVVATDSSGSVENFLTTFRRNFEVCKGQKIDSPIFGDTYRMTDFVDSDDLLVGTIEAEGATDYRCQHAVGSRDGFIAEAMVCGYPDDHAENIVTEILDAAPQ